MASYAAAAQALVAQNAGGAIPLAHFVTLRVLAALGASVGAIGGSPAYVPAGGASLVRVGSLAPLLRDLTGATGWTARTPIWPGSGTVPASGVPGQLLRDWRASDLAALLGEENLRFLGECRKFVGQLAPTIGGDVAAGLTAATDAGVIVSPAPDAVGVMAEAYVVFKPAMAAYAQAKLAEATVEAAAANARADFWEKVEAGVLAVRDVIPNTIAAAPGFIASVLGGKNLLFIGLAITGVIAWKMGLFSAVGARVAKAAVKAVK